MRNISRLFFVLIVSLIFTVFIVQYKVNLVSAENSIVIPPINQPTCTPNDQIRTEQDCVGNQLCTFNIFRGSSCNEGRGGAYNCQNIVGKCGYNPTPVSTPAPAPACNTLVNSITCGQPSYDTCTLHTDASGRNRYDCVASQNHLCTGVILCTAQNPSPQPPTPTQQQCPGPGQAGTQQVCGGQWAYDECDIVQRFSDGSPARYSCRFSGNRNCQGDISCAAPATTTPSPVNQCRSITCPSAPAGCAYSNQVTDTCNPNVSLTCGSLVCNPGVNPPPSVPSNPAPIIITNNTSSSSTSSSNNTNNNTITGSVGIGTSVPTAVYYAGVKQLPNTGLPLLAWAIGAFLPAGLGLKKVGRVKKQLDANPNYLWEKRQYHRS